MTIGDRFREVREKTGLDQDQFAEKVGKSRTTINR
ncbi:MAG: helix-turn-helix transcriptional regulator, partial [bacterium]|nr:helix-turn-helix transcriptional regulator [bacterium]